MRGLGAGALILVGALRAQTPVPDPVVASQQALVQRYCIGCHNNKLKSGSFSWERVDLAHPAGHAEDLENVLRMLHAGMMPPPGLPRPDPAAMKNFISSLETRIDEAAARDPEPGNPRLHRLNRSEYRNSIRDLLGLNVDVASLLPPDDMSHGFDNMSEFCASRPR